MAVFVVLGAACGEAPPVATAPLPDLADLGSAEHFPRYCPTDEPCLDRAVVAHTTIDSVASAFEALGYAPRLEADDHRSLCLPDREDRCAHISRHDNGVLLYVNVAEGQSLEP